MNDSDRKDHQRQHHEDSVISSKPDLTGAPSPELSSRSGVCIVNPNPPRQDELNPEIDTWDVWCTAERLVKQTKSVATNNTSDDRSSDRKHSHSNIIQQPRQHQHHEQKETVTHTGGCHCGKIRFQCQTSTTFLTVWDCNCSDCRLRKNAHFVVPKSCFQINSGGNNLTEYRWGTGTARHYFCATCGISPFYIPRSNPDGYAITFVCLDAGTVSNVDIRRFDGRHWEDFIEAEGKDIKACSLGSD